MIPQPRWYSFLKKMPTSLTSIPIDFTFLPAVCACVFVCTKNRMVWILYFPLHRYLVRFQLRARHVQYRSFIQMKSCKKINFFSIYIIIRLDFSFLFHHFSQISFYFFVFDFKLYIMSLWNSVPAASLSSEPHPRYSLAVLWTDSLFF